MILKYFCVCLSTVPETKLHFFWKKLKVKIPFKYITNFPWAYLLSQKHALLELLWHSNIDRNSRLIVFAYLSMRSCLGNLIDIVWPQDNFFLKVTKKVLKDFLKSNYHHPFFFANICFLKTDKQVFPDQNIRIAGRQCSSLKFGFIKCNRPSRKTNVHEKGVSEVYSFEIYTKLLCQSRITHKLFFLKGFKRPSPSFGFS